MEKSLTSGWRLAPGAVRTRSAACRWKRAELITAALRTGSVRAATQRHGYARVVSKLRRVQISMRRTRAAQIKDVLTSLLAGSRALLRTNARAHVAVCILVLSRLAAAARSA